MTTKRMTRIALCAALLAPCAWLSIPTQPPFTMQTFGVFLTLLCNPRACAMGKQIYKDRGEEGEAPIARNAAFCK